MTEEMAQMEPAPVPAPEKQEMDQRQEELAALKAQLALAVARYRGLLLASAPELPEEMVAGDTVEEVEASAARAREVVERVRRQLEARAQAQRVPAGAPPRTQPDLSSLSPGEKIAYALNKQRP
jgi:hypothetical protein